MPIGDDPLEARIQVLALSLYLAGSLFFVAGTLVSMYGILRR